MCPLLFGFSGDNAAGTGVVPVACGGNWRRKEAAPTRLREECLAGAVIRAASGTGGTGVAALHTQRGRRRGVPKKVCGQEDSFYRAPRGKSSRRGGRTGDFVPFGHFRGQATM